MFSGEVAANEVAAFILEPILGEGGFVVPPDYFLPALRKIADQHGIMLIIDEVQSGVARSGKWFAHQYYEDLRPDIMLFAKGIASGMPLSGFVAPRRIMSQFSPGSHGGTYGGNAVSVAAACATLDVLQEENILKNVVERGQELDAALRALQAEFPNDIIDVLGRGLMRAIQLRSGLYPKIVDRAFENNGSETGLLLLCAS